VQYFYGRPQAALNLATSLIECLFAKSTNALEPFTKRWLSPFRKNVDCTDRPKQKQSQPRSCHNRGEVTSLWRNRGCAVRNSHELSSRTSFKWHHSTMSTERRLQQCVHIIALDLEARRQAIPLWAMMQSNLFICVNSGFQQTKGSENSLDLKQFCKSGNAIPHVNFEDVLKAYLRD